MSDTIFAISTPPGKSGVAIIRTSGPQSAAGAETLTGALPPTRKPVLRTLRDPRDGDIIDHALILAFEAPKSFTGEDSVEYHVHGSRAVIKGLLDALGRMDRMRPADPGEFTRRAFENGKLDLTQIEGLADLVQAETKFQRLQAIQSLDGAFHRHIEDWRQRLIRCLALAEAGFDFADEGEITDSIEDNVARDAHALQTEMAALLADDHIGERIRDGLTIVIAGPPNAGKSTLLNRLAARDVAITSPIAGTTRDLLEVSLDLAGTAVTLIDTAGLQETSDAIEREGVRRAKDRMAAADLIIWLVDLTDPMPPPADRQAPIWVVGNKSDQFIDDKAATDIRLSAKTGDGLGDLVKRLRIFAETQLSGRETALITRARHRQCLSEACGHLRRYSSGTELPNDIRVDSLRQAVDSLGRLTGSVDADMLLDVIFSEFCLGK